MRARPIDRLRDRIIGTELESTGRRLARLARSLQGADPSAEVAKSRLYDDQTVEIAKRVLQPDANIIDVGAHRGSLLERLIALAPQGEHVAVEPLPRHAESLRRRFPGVTVHQAALAEASGTARFREVVGAPEHSSLEGLGHEAGEANVEFFEVPVRTLDEIAPARVDFVKIDAEQAEFQILKGGERVLAMKPFIAFELGANQNEVWEHLTSRGYLITRLSDWLDSRPPPPNVEALRHDVKGEYFFLAYPA